MIDIKKKDNKTARSQNAEDSDQRASPAAKTESLNKQGKFSCE